MQRFILVVDGEVAGELPLTPILAEDGNLHPAIEKLVAILSSDPTIVVSDNPIPQGWTWDGETFHDLS